MIGIVVSAALLGIIIAAICWSAKSASHMFSKTAHLDQKVLVYLAVAREPLRMRVLTSLGVGFLPYADPSRGSALIVMDDDHGRILRLPFQWACNKSLDCGNTEATDFKTPAPTHECPKCGECECQCLGGVAFSLKVFRATIPFVLPGRSTNHHTRPVRVPLSSRSSRLRITVHGVTA